MAQFDGICTVEISVQLLQLLIKNFYLFRREWSHGKALEISLISVWISLLGHYVRAPQTFFPSESCNCCMCRWMSAVFAGKLRSSGTKRLVPLKWLIAVGSGNWSGKERIILSIAETFDLLIYADDRKGQFYVFTVARTGRPSYRWSFSRRFISCQWAC